MIKAFLFDLDGVLVDTYNLWFHLVNDAAKFLGYPPIPAKKFQSIWGQGTEGDIANLFSKHTLSHIEQVYDARFSRHLHHLHVMDGALAFLKSIALPKAVVTNSSQKYAKKVLELGGMNTFFQTIIGSDEVERSKPAPDMIFEACRRLMVSPLEVLFIGDTRFDEQAAKAAGVRFIQFNSFRELQKLSNGVLR